MTLEVTPYVRPRGEDQEKVILSSQGAFKGHLRSGWRLGHFSLTAQRLSFSTPAGRVFHTPCASLTAITVERQKFVLRTKPVLCVSYTPPGAARGGKIWMILADLETWRKKIWEMMAVRLNPDMIARVASHLNPGGQEILGYLWHKGHASIVELADLIDAPTHTDVLLTIREGINPAAQRLLGFPLVVFEHAKVDEETGETITFHWWMVRGSREARMREPLLDIFDEPHQIVVILELGGIPEDQVHLTVRNNILSVQVSPFGTTVYKDIPLPAPVNPESFITSWNNNILSVQLDKRNCERRME